MYWELWLENALENLKYTDTSLTWLVCTTSWYADSLTDALRVISFRGSMPWQGFRSTQTSHLNYGNYDCTRVETGHDINWTSFFNGMTAKRFMALVVSNFATEESLIVLDSR